MKTTHLLAAAILLAAGFSANLRAQPAEAGQPRSVIDLRDALVRIAKNQYRPTLRVSFGSFTYEYTPIGSSFARFLEERLTTAISQTGDKVNLFALGALKNLDPSFSKAFGAVINVEGVESVLSGRYFDAGDSVRFQLEIVDFTTGTLVGKEEVRIAKSEIPSGISLLPPNLQNATAVFKELEDVIKSGDDRFLVKATTNRGNGAVFKDGEEMVVNFFSNRDAYIKIYLVDAEGKTQLIFPNKFHANNHVPKEKLVQIPGPGYPFAFVLGPPYGTEFIKVIASTAQFKDVEESFKDLGKVNKGLMTRGIVTEERKGEQAQTLVNYTIVK